MNYIFPTGINVGVQQRFNNNKMGFELLTPNVLLKKGIINFLETSGHKKKILNQGLLGISEIIFGVAGFVGVTAIGLGAEAEALKTQQQIDPSVGEKMMLGYSLSSVFIADGINLFVEATREKESQSIVKTVLINLITDPMVDVGKGLLFAKEELERRKEDEGD